MTSPHYISEDKSDMRGINSSGPFASREECIKKITQPTNGTNDGV
jgi:hypothetical protein